VAFCISEALSLALSPPPFPGIPPFAFPGRISPSAFPAPWPSSASFRGQAPPFRGGAPTAAGNALTVTDKATASIPPDSARDPRAARPS